jgi:hypothetical protein
VIARYIYVVAAKAQRTEGQLLQENEVENILKSQMLFIGTVIPAASKGEG